MGWNSNTWGPACFSVDEAHVATADGKLIVANQQSYPDLFWAIRGAGPGFFGNVTQYKLKLYTAPRSITSSTYFYPLRHVHEVGAWASGIAANYQKKLSSLSSLRKHLPTLAEHCKSENGYVLFNNARFSI